MKTHTLEQMRAEAKRARKLALAGRQADAYANLYAIAEYADGGRLSPVDYDVQFASIAVVFAVVRANFASCGDSDVQAMADRATEKLIAILRT